MECLCKRARVIALRRRRRLMTRIGKENFDGCRVGRIASVEVAYLRVAEDALLVNKKAVGDHGESVKVPQPLGAITAEGKVTPDASVKRRATSAPCVSMEIEKISKFS